MERSMFVAVLLAGLLPAACSPRKAEGALAGQIPAVTVQALDGTGLKRVTLTVRSAERIGIRTAPVTEANLAGARRTVMPFAALLYDERGGTWAYTNPEGLVFLRHRVTVELIQGDVAVLSDGPPVGTLVVTVGAAELYGSETGVGGH